jgi:hypothetical protein
MKPCSDGDPRMNEVFLAFKTLQHSYSSLNHNLGWKRFKKDHGKFALCVQFCRPPGKRNWMHMKDGIETGRRCAPP